MNESIGQSISITTSKNWEGQGDKQLTFSKYPQIFKIEKISGVCFLSREGFEMNPES